MGQDMSCAVARDACTPGFGSPQSKSTSNQPHVKLVDGEVPDMPNTPIEFMDAFIKFRSARDVSACLSLVTGDVQIITPFGMVTGKTDAAVEFGKPIPQFVVEKPLALKQGGGEVVQRGIYIEKGPFRFNFIQEYELIRDEREKLRLNKMSMIKGENSPA